MELNNILIVEKNSNMNLLSVYYSYLKNSIGIKSNGYTYMSKDIKFEDSSTLDSIIINDLLAQTLTSCHNKFIEKRLMEINCSEAFDIYDLIPNTKSEYVLLSEDQKFAFKILRLIIQKKNLLIIEEQTMKISSELFHKTKNLFQNLCTNHNYTIIIETNNFQNWSDICDNFIEFKNNKFECIPNKIRKNYSVEKNFEVYQLAL